MLKARAAGVTGTAPNRRKGVLLMVGAGLCWSLGGLIVRSITVKDTWEIVFWRSLFMGLIVAVVLAVMHGRHAWAQVRAVGVAGVVAALCPAAQIYFFILSLQIAAAPNLLPTILIAGVIAALPALLLAPTLAATARDIGLLALMGCVQLGLGCVLMTLAVPHLRAAQTGLLALIEPILAPLWVWLGVGEVPAGAALAGGALIIGALVANGWVSLREESAR
jgi:drug/metabolite transporter (DMT)-like permease